MRPLPRTAREDPPGGDPRTRMARIHQALFAALDEPLTVWTRTPGGPPVLADLNPAAMRLLRLDQAAVGGAPDELGEGALWTAMARALARGQAETVVLPDGQVRLRPLSLGDGAVALRLAVDRPDAGAEQRADLTHLASHDLQEPLRIVSMYAQLLDRHAGAALDETARGHLDTILNAIRRMYRLIDDLLALSDVDETPIARAPVDLQAVVGDVVAVLGDEARDAHVRAKGLPTVLGTERLLRQVFARLIDNALRYRSERPPVVEIAAAREGDRWRITVTDNGIGVDPAFTERIFEPFRRLHTYEVHPGTGIGLAICKRVVERHGGRIGVESAPGGGSRFHLTLPASR